MKKFIVFAIIISMFTLSGCQSYDEGYNDGYYDGYEDGLNEMSDELNEMTEKFHIAHSNWEEVSKENARLKLGLKP